MERTDALRIARLPGMNDLTKQSSWLVALLVCVLVVCLNCKRQGDNSSQVPPVVLPGEDKTTEELRTSPEALILNRQFTAAADRLRRADIDLLVADARARADLRWMAVDEDTVVLPGLNDQVLLQSTSDEYWTIPGTSDAILDVEWQNTATRFAEDYNQRLQRSLEEAPPSP